MADELEKRLIKLESKIEHLVDSIDDIKDILKEAMEAKSKLDDHNGQLKKLWIKVDAGKEEREKLEARVATLEHHHATYSEERPMRLQRLRAIEDWRERLQIELGNCSPKIQAMDVYKVQVDNRLDAIEKAIGSASGFIVGRVASVTDKLIWIGIGVFAVLAVTFALKGISK